MAKSLSIVDYMHELKDAGFTDRQAEIQAKRIEQIITDVKAELKAEIKLEFNISELTTKKDLELAIEKLRYEALKFTVWTGVAVIVTIGSMLAKGFNWF